MGSFFSLRQTRLHTFLSRAPAPALFFLSNVYAHIYFASADTRLFFESPGCHGNSAQVGRGELGGTLRPPRRATDIKELEIRTGGEESERGSV